MIYDWPPPLTLFGVAFNRRGQSIAGPVSLIGQAQVAQSDAGYWVATYSRVWAMEPAKVKLFRALTALLEGGANQVRLPVQDVEQQPWVLSGGLPVTSNAQVPHDDLATFDDGSGYLDTPLYVINVNAAAAGDTQITGDFLLSGSIVGGEYFSVGDYLYQIRGILDTSGTQKTLFIWPRLREAVAVGAELNFHAPACRMRMASDSDGDLHLELGRFGSPDMNFVEVFT